METSLASLKMGLMEKPSPTLQDLADQAREAIRTGSQDKLAELPRQALLLTACQGLAVYRLELARHGRTLSVRQYELELNDRLAHLTDREKEQVTVMAESWLADNASAGQA